MQTVEKTYLRKSLGVKCRSSQIARSFLDKRIAPDEIFLLGEESYTFRDLLARDAIIREMVGSKLENLRENSGKRPADSIAWRFDLFKRIVLRGDDSSFLFLNELDAKEKQIGQLREELRSREEQLSRSQRNGEKLARACRNAGQAVQSFAHMLEAQKRNLLPDSELSAQYREMVSIAGAVVEELRTNLQKNWAAATASDCDSASEPEVTEFNTLDTFRAKTEQTMAERKARQEAELLASRKEFDAMRESSLQKWKEEQKAAERAMAERREKQEAELLALRKEREAAERTMAERRAQQEAGLLALRESSLRKLKEEREEFERYKEKVNHTFEERRNQFQQTAEQQLEKIEEERKQNEQRIERWKEAAIAAVRKEKSELLKLQMDEEEFDQKISEKARQIFSPFSTSDRFYLPPSIPIKAFLIPVRIISWRDISAKSILAFYDCSKDCDGSIGILITTREVCLYNGQFWQRFPLLQEEEFHVMTTFVEEIRRGKQNGITFMLRSYGELERFCQAVNELCAYLRDLGEQAAPPVQNIAGE